MEPQKILIINTKYRIFGGEDSNIADEITLLKKHFEIEKLIKITNSVKSVEWKKKRRNSYSMQNKKFNSEVNYRILVNILSR